MKGGATGPRRRQEDDGVEPVPGPRLSLEPKADRRATERASRRSTSRELLEPKTPRDLEDLEADEDVSAWVHDRQSDWGSLLADLSRPEENATLRVHDRTHLEFLLDYDLRPDAKTETFEWEAYFFAPESLRLSSRTYDKQDLYSDLQSYVRFAVPEAPFTALCGAPLEKVKSAIQSGEPSRILTELRLYACVVRAAGVDARRSILAGLAVAPASIAPAPPPASPPVSGAGVSEDGAAAGSSSPAVPSRRAVALAAAERMIEDVAVIARSLRTAIEPARTMPDPISTAVQWTDEDISRLLETLMANLSLGLRDAHAPEAIAEAAARAAVAEARYRVANDLDGVGRVSMASREIEHLEFRRHVLKRFTSSVLWLEPEVKAASMWVLHFLYAIAASVAMAFATAAALWNPTGMSGTAGFFNTDFFKWAVVVIIAYAAKDRIKALLQTIFQDVVARHFPDRSWRIRDAAKKNELATMEEQSGFLGPFLQHEFPMENQVAEVYQVV